MLTVLPRVVIGETWTFSGAEDSLKKHGVSVELVQDSQCIDLMEAFIKAKPMLWNEDIGK
jgi:hypothetical protein